MATPRVFISMGTPYNEIFSRFRDSLEAFLRDQCGVDPRIIGKNEYPDGNPLSKIKSVMESCDGVIVVAYERKFLQSGVEKRSSKNSVDLSDRTYTTPWNHIESAMAYSLGIPLYILCQRGLSEEGLIESKLDWYVQYVDIHPDDFQRTDVSQSLVSWIKSRVVPRGRKPRFLRTVEGNIKLSEMTPKEIAGAIGVIMAAFSAGIAAMKFFPRLLG